MEKIHKVKARFPVLKHTGNSFFYSILFVRQRITAFFVFGLLVFVSLFNLADAYRGGNLYALSLGAFKSEEIESFGLANLIKPAHSSGEVVYDLAENGRGGGEENDPFLDEAAYPTTPDDALQPDLTPLVIDQNQDSRDQIVYYTVEDGDTVSEIADKFGLAPNTLIWANNLSSAEYIKAGQRLEILPVDGIKHVVQKGDTVTSLAQKFKSDAEDIIAFNDLPADGQITVGDALIIPGGRPYQSPRPPAPKAARKPASIAVGTANKYFIFPTTGRISQGPHTYNAVDIASQCGTPIYAAADGVADVKITNSRARTGPSVYSGYGNHIKITHPNGAVTLYGHLKEIYIPDGAEVKQGDVIASMGGGFEYVNGKLLRMAGAGRSTGCHLHFEVRGAPNPVLSNRR